MGILSDAEDYLAQQVNSYIGTQRQQATQEVNQNVNQQAAQAQTAVQTQIQQQADIANAQIAHTGNVVEMVAWLAVGTIAVGTGYWLARAR